MQCAPGSLGDHPLPIPSDSVLILTPIGAPEPWRQRQGAVDGQPAVELWTQARQSAPTAAISHAA
eukprot:823801-Prymnesium_polylepis.1